MANREVEPFFRLHGFSIERTLACLQLRATAFGAVVGRLRGAVLDEARATEALKEAELARKNAQVKQEVATVEAELAMLGAQLASIRKLRGKR